MSITVSSAVDTLRIEQGGHDIHFLSRPHGPQGFLGAVITSVEIYISLSGLFLPETIDGFYSSP